MKTLFLSSVFPNPAAPVRGTFNQMLCRALNATGDVRVIAPVPWPEVLRSRGKQYATARSSAADVASGDVASGHVASGHVAAGHVAAGHVAAGHVAAGRTSGSGQSHTESPHVLRPAFYYPPKILRHHYGRFMWASVRKCVRRVTRDFHPDWVLSYWAHPDGQAAQLAAHQIGARSAVIIGGSDVLLLTRESRRRRQIQKVLHQADAVLAVCDGLRDRAIELGASADRVHTLYQGIDPNVFSPGSRQDARKRLGLPAAAPQFIWVGRMVDVKRLDVLVESFARIVQSRPDARLYLLGSGSCAPQIRRRVCACGLADSIIFVGPVEQDRLPDWYRAADATLLSSDSEGLPNVLRESLACGTPWVSTDVGSVREIAGVEHSICVPAGDVEQFSGAALQILDPFYKAGAANYRARTWKDTARDLTRIFNGQSVDPDKVDLDKVDLDKVAASRGVTASLEECRS